MTHHKRRFWACFITAILAIIFVLTGCASTGTSSASDSASGAVDTSSAANATQSSSTFDFNAIPAYSGTPYCVINNNTPSFSDSDLTTNSFENYSELDNLGRVGVANASLSKDTMPKSGEHRQGISSVKPTGWHSNVPGTQAQVYNRCHLIAWELGDENANWKNLATGTRYMNVDGMLPFENQVADYIKETGNHVRYRVTPRFKDNELVCRGIQMEAESVEDKGAGVKFNVYCYDVQDGITINYSDGTYSKSDGTTSTQSSTNTNNNTASSQTTPRTTADGTMNIQTTANQEASSTYVINTHSGIFHKLDGSDVGRISAKNKAYTAASRTDLINAGYKACGTCKP